MKKYSVIIVVVLSVIILFYVFMFQRRIYKKTAYYMDTVIEVQIYYHGFINVSKIADEALNDFNLIDSICGYASKNGDIYHLNNEKRGEVSAYTKTIIDSSILVSKLTDGYFDITVGPILTQWKHFSEPLDKIPDSSTVKHLLKFINYREIRQKGDSVFLPDSASIDLGGIAKGYAIDLAYNDLIKHNLDAFLINAGGDIRVYSKGKKKWRIGIQDPRENSIMGYFDIGNGAVVTSGDYERYVIVKGVRYSHLINPKTGYPEHGIASVTVFADNATYADAMATAISVMGKRGIEYAKKNKIRGIIVYYKGDSLAVWESKALKGYVTYEKGFIPKTFGK